MNPTVAAINTQTLAFLPSVLAGVHAAEQSNADGATKSQAVVNAIIAGSGSLAAGSNPDVVGIAALVNLTVSILNALGVFKHKAK